MTDEEVLSTQDGTAPRGEESPFEDSLLKEDSSQGSSDSLVGSEPENILIESPSDDCGFGPETYASCNPIGDDFADEGSDSRSTDAMLEQILETLHRLEGAFAAKIDRSEYELETLKKQSEEIQEYKADLYASILAPVLRPLVKTHAYMKRAILKTQASGADSIPLNEFEFAYDDVNDVIEDSGVEIRSFEKGDLFESSYMKISGQNKVAEPEKNKTVSVVSSDAYIFKNTVLEKARTVVNVYSDEQSLAQNE